MYGQPRGGLLLEDSGRGLKAEVLYMPGTLGCFFYAVLRRKGGSVPRPREFWVGRRVGGWEWERGNPGLPGSVE